jgi:hypothetical protein
MARLGRGYPIRPFWRRPALTAATSGQTFALPVATETDTAQALSRRKTRALPVANEVYTPSYAAVIGALSLGSRYTLDDTSGTVAAAAVGSAGSYSGTVTLSASRIVKDAGTAVTTDGVTGVIATPAAAGAVGVGFWFREGTGSAAGIPMCRDNTTAGGTGWYLDTTGTNPVVRAAGTNHTVTTVLSSTLHTGDHLAVIQTDGTNVQLFIDGTQVDTWVKAAAFTTNSWFFGRNGGVTTAGNYWNGTWDEIFFPTALLSAADVTNLWNAGTAASVGGAQALGRVKRLALPTATTTSAAQPLGRVKSRALPVATETDAAQTLGRSKRLALPVATEADTAQALARVKSRVLPIASGTGTAQPLGRVKSRGLPISTEADAAQTLGRRKTRVLPIATETDTAQPITRATGAHPLPVATETDAAQTLGRVKVRALPTATETDTARPVARTKTKALPVAVETDAAQLLVRVKRKALPIATETDSAVGVTRVRIRALPPAFEIDDARPLARRKTLVLPIAVELDLAQPITRGAQRPAPPERMWVLPPERRLLYVQAEARTVTLPAGRRVAELPPERRRSVVPPESRRTRAGP